MLVTLKDVLDDAQKNKYGVALFNALNMEMARGVIAAAEELNAPVIIGTAEGLLKYSPLQELSYFLLPLVKAAKVPVVLHLDHGLTEDVIFQAMKLGFSSVMYDCSTKPYEENIARVAEMTKIAHRFGCTIEGEIGHVGSNSDVKNGLADQYTLPEEASYFAERTGVDALAVAIGSAHGVYKTKPKLDILRLREIAGAVSTPLVLHGGSGLSDQDFRDCIENGICKINIFTDINLAASQSIASNYREGTGMSVLLPQTVEAVKEAAKKKMLVFGCQNRA
jgi:fructose-bisphosphate aldolase, class II